MRAAVHIGVSGMIRAQSTGAGAAGGVLYTPRPTSSSPLPTRPSGIGLDRARTRLAGNDDAARDKAAPHPPWDGEMIRSLVDQQISARGNLRGRVVGRRAACRVAGSIIDELLSIALGGGVHRPAVTKRSGRASDAPERDGRWEEGAREAGARDARALGCARRGGRITRRQGGAVREWEDAAVARTKNCASSTTSRPCCAIWPCQGPG